jgi:hypothetical protein
MICGMMTGTGAREAKRTVRCRKIVRFLETTIVTEAPPLS